MEASAALLPMTFWGELLRGLLLSWAFLILIRVRKGDLAGAEKREPNLHWKGHEPTEQILKQNKGDKVSVGRKEAGWDCHSGPQ